MARHSVGSFDFLLVSTVLLAAILSRLLPLTKKWKYRRLWFRTYPEINRVLFFGNGQYHSTYREKIWFIVVAIGLYPKFKKYLGGKHLRPFPEWMVL